MVFNHKKGEYLEVDGCRIYFEEGGKKNKPPLLVLHGGFESIENMNSLTAGFLENYRIIGIDSRGHGMSEMGREKLTYSRFQKDAEAVLQYLGIPEVSILGFSDGGITALRVASEGNVLVKKLIVLGASWCHNDIEESKEVIESVTPENTRNWFQHNYNRYRELNPDPRWDELTQSLRSLWKDPSQKGYPGDRVSYIRAETLLIRGDGDFFVSLESYGVLQKSIEKASLFNVPGAEHEVHAEQPEVVKKAVMQFLSTC